MVNEAQVVTVMKDAILTTIYCSAPMLAIAIVIGLVVSIFQATTQINEQTLSFAPKLVGILIAILVFGGWILGRLQDFSKGLFEAMLHYIG